MIDRARMHKALDRMIDSRGDGRARDDDAGLSKARADWSKAEAEFKKAGREWDKAQDTWRKAFAEWRKAQARAA